MIPLRSDLAERIKSGLASRTKPKDQEQRIRISKKRTGEMLEVTLFLCFFDSQGRDADFHALRKTFITNLSKFGVSPKMAQSLARHSDINLTMNVYIDVVLEDQAFAVELLPELPTLVLSPTEGENTKDLRGKCELEKACGYRT